MKEVVKIEYNGQEMEVEKGATLLSIARERHIYIPTLCHNDALEPYGVCRMCLVEIEDRGRMRVVTSCNYPAKEGLKVKTDTERVVTTRNVVVELLLARAPENEEIQRLAGLYGIEGGRLELVEPIKDECILCGMCVRTCDEVVGVKALGFANRGIDRVPATPFMESSETCIGCGSCVYVCPTGYIKMRDEKGKRYIENWKVELELSRCESCGAYIAPKRQLDYIRNIADLPNDFYNLCWNCR